MGIPILNTYILDKKRLSNPPLCALEAFFSQAIVARELNGTGVRQWKTKREVQRLSPPYFSTFDAFDYGATIVES